jgi:cytochrome c oxidase cbb3-type subunit IV
MKLNYNLLSSVVTVAWFVSFIALWLWAWNRRRRADFAAAARMPLEEDSASPAGKPTGSGRCHRS